MLLEKLKTKFLHGINFKLSVCAVLLAIVCLCLPLVLAGCGGTAEAKNCYDISAVFDDESKTLVCTQEVKYFNTSENKLNEICFFLYANTFNEGKKAVTNAYFDRAFPSGEESYGGIEISSAKVGGKDAEFSVSETGNILSVKLFDGLFPDESTEIELEYVVRLANIRHRLGYGNSTINFGNFFPIACVYEDGFVKNDFAQNGDPFYSEVSNFEVEITYPSKFILASSGEQTEVSSKKNMGSEQNKTTLCQAENVRDFCFVLSEKFEKISASAGDVEVNYYFYDDENAQEHLLTSVKAIETFSELFGQYPYSQISVVKSDFCFGGMEYPNLVLIADDLADAETFDYVIVHELAHQWWYGLVGNNEFTNAWVDEGLTEYSTALFYEQNAEYGLDYDVIMQNATDTYRNFVKIYANIFGKVDESMNRNLLQYKTEPEYVNCTYTKGMLLFDNIRSMMSDRKFFKCLKAYFNEYEYKNSSAAALVESFCKTSHINLQPLFSAWIEGKVKIN